MNALTARVVSDVEILNRVEIIAQEIGTELDAIRGAEAEIEALTGSNQGGE